MKLTKNMVFKESAEATELYVYCLNNGKLYRNMQACYTNLDRKRKKGVYDSLKAIELFYCVANKATEMYNKEFGYKFTVTERWTAATMLRDCYENDGEI